MTELSHGDKREEDTIRRDSNGAIDYEYYQQLGRRARAETAWDLVRCILTGRNRKSKNQQ